MTDRMIELLADAREWLEESVGETADTVDALSDRMVFGAVGRRYPGGWDKFALDH